MPTLKLTKSTVEKTKPSAREQIFWDANLSGFGLRVKPTGRKSFLVQYRNRETGRSTRMTLGPFGPLLSATEARERARQILAKVVAGEDPASDRKLKRQAMSVEEFAETYLSEHAIPKKRPSSVRNDKSMLANHILPSIGSRKLADVTSKDIQRIHNRLQETPYVANRVLALVSKMFSLAIRWNLCVDNPCKGIEKFQEQPRERWLSSDELERLSVALNSHPNQNFADAIRLQLLTGARIGEIKLMRTSDVDFERGVWIKPSHHTKQKRTEHLPLSQAAIGVLRRSIDRGPGPLIFPGAAADKPIVDLKYFWKNLMDTAEIEDYRIHDNRHTYASHLVSHGESLVTVGKLLGHTNQSTTQRYAHLADDPLRKATDSAAERFNLG